jgi:hypothetical protein
MSEGFKQFDDLSKGLYAAIVAIDIATINGLLRNIDSNPIATLSCSMFLISIFIMIVGLGIGCLYSKEEGSSSKNRNIRDINRMLFWFLVISALFSLIGIAMTLVSSITSAGICL